MTSCRLSPAVVTEQANRLLEATVRKVGTDEAAVTEVSCTAKQNNCVAKLDQTVFDLMTLDERTAFNDGILGKTDRVISRIFQDELEGTDLSHAQDCLAQGHITHRDGRFDYFRDGILDLVDLSSTSSQIGAAVVIGGIAILCVVAPPAAIAVGTVLLVGTATVSGVAVIKNGIEIATGDSPANKNDWRDLGHASAGLTMAAMPLRPALHLYRETWIPHVTPALPFSHLARSQGVLPELSQLPIMRPAASGVPPSDAFRLSALLGEQDASASLATAASLYKSCDGGTQLYKVKIHWTDNRTTVLIWDRLDGLLFQIKDGHIVNSEPGMWPLIPDLVTKIMQRKALAYVDGIRSVEVLEVSEYAAHQMRPDPVLPPWGF